MKDAPRPSDLARNVLEVEAEALSMLRRDLPDTFDEVVERLLDIEGRVIVSGMGKSGHVAAKIAATMASTGTPAQFVHPGEASHGDLGMVTKKDVVIIISNNGENRELADIIGHCARYSIPMIAITKKPDSTLGKQSDHVLQMPDAPEACGIGMAPTTSTTCAMAMGDALAVTLMRLRGFDRESFLAFHPGGTLGAQLLKVSAVMHKGEEIPIVSETTPMSDTLIEMTAKGFGVAAVVENTRLTGVITDGDLRRNMDDLMSRTAGDVATREPLTITQDTLLVEALGLMNAKKRTVLLVVDDDDHLCGLVHIHDALRAGVA
ncbi:MAG: KpsF/GutQ family sugar-phosphate isomerase [Pseudomonadota bacterium]